MPTPRPAVARKPVPLDEDDLSHLSCLKTSSSIPHQALLDLAGEQAVKSEASILHALLTLGWERVDEQVQLAGYAALAAAQDHEDRAFHAALRKRARGGHD